MSTLKPATFFAYMLIPLRLLTFPENPTPVRPLRKPSYLHTYIVSLQGHLPHQLTQHSPLQIRLLPAFRILHPWPARPTASAPAPIKAYTPGSFTGQSLRHLDDFLRLTASRQLCKTTILPMCLNGRHFHERVRKNSILQILNPKYKALLLCDELLEAGMDGQRGAFFISVPYSCRQRDDKASGNGRMLATTRLALLSEIPLEDGGCLELL